MPFLLDTTVLVDLERQQRETMAWVAGQDPNGLHVSVISVAELVRGGHKRHRADAAARDAYLERLNGLWLQAFQNRVLAFEREDAEIWGRLVDEGEARGRMPPSDDAKIAAIALRHGFTVATSNTRHLADLCPVVDPRTA